MELLGPQVERTFKAFAKYCKALGAFLELPAISALNLRWGRERVSTLSFTMPLCYITHQFKPHKHPDTHVFFVRIRAKETILKKTSRTTRGCITFKLLSAECKTMREMHELLDWRSGPFCGPEVTELTMAHRPGLLRLFVMDVSGILPPPLDGYTLPTDVSNWPASLYKKYNPRWLEKLLESIDQPMTGPLAGQEEFASSIFTVNCEEPQVPPARPSSPVEDTEESNTDTETAATAALEFDELENAFEDM